MDMKTRGSAVGVACLAAATYSFYQYTLRSAPAVMMPQLSDAFNLSAVAVASMVGVFYYGYSACSLVAGPAVDPGGGRAILPAGALLTGFGALLFSTGNLTAANVGRVLQGCGGAFALVGAIYIASNNFPASRAATLTGSAQMFGMAGGSAGQLLVAPVIAGGLLWSHFWIAMAVTGMLTGAALLFFLPEQKRDRISSSKPDPFTALFTVLNNPQ